MASRFTIFGKNADYSGILERIRKRTTLSIEVVGNASAWDSIVIRGHDATLTFNAMVKVAPADQFSKIVLGATNFFQRIKTEAVVNQTFIKNAILSSKILFGVVADPQLIEEAGYFDLVFDVADQADGVIFNGTGMIDSAGKLLLDNEGSYDRLLA